MSYLRIFFADAVTAQQEAIFRGALADWEAAIISHPDVSPWRTSEDFYISELCDVGWYYPAGAGNDGLDIFVRVQPIDGSLGVLARAGPCGFINQEPRLAVITMDSDDIEGEEDNGRLFDVVRHEIGHCVGIGTSGFTLNGLLLNGGGEDPQFTGAFARAAYLSLGGSGNVPVQEFQSGHWRESTFGNELMTPFISTGTNPLSIISLSSLQDLGFVADTSFAESYSLPKEGDNKEEMIEMLDDVAVYENTDLAAALKKNHEKAVYRRRVMGGGVAVMVLALALIVAVFIKRKSKKENKGMEVIKTVVRSFLGLSSNENR
eukprot:snap_masked-scaffold_35-processed-gene-1.42-mRNA-1 protein AED:1.00 eAED:1.00 QI:0/0/0/0/1/1/2/0/318